MSFALFVTLLSKKVWIQLPFWTCCDKSAKIAVVLSQRSQFGEMEAVRRALFLLWSPNESRSAITRHTHAGSYSNNSITLREQILHLASNGIRRPWRSRTNSGPQGAEPADTQRRVGKLNISPTAATNCNTSLPTAVYLFERSLLHCLFCRLPTCELSFCMYNAGALGRQAITLRRWLSSFWWPAKNNNNNARRRKVMKFAFATPSAAPAPCSCARKFSESAAFFLTPLPSPPRERAR